MFYQVNIFCFLSLFLPSLVFTFAKIKLSNLRFAYFIFIILKVAKKPILSLPRYSDKWRDYWIVIMSLLFWDFIDSRKVLLQGSFQSSVFWDAIMAEKGYQVQCYPGSCYLSKHHVVPQISSTCLKFVWVMVYFLSSLVFFYGE